MQKGIFVVLVLIAFLLGANLFKGNEAKAAKNLQYTAINVRGDRKVVQEALDTYSKEGWELVTIYPNFNVFIFKK